MCVGGVCGVCGGGVRAWVYHNDDVFLVVMVKVVHQLRQLSKLVFVISEYQFAIHIVNITPLDVLCVGVCGCVCVGV